MELGKHASYREKRVLRFIDMYKDEEVNYYDIATNINFGDERSNVGVDIVIDDLIAYNMIEHKRIEWHDYYTITEKGKEIIKE